MEASDVSMKVTNLGHLLITECGRITETTFKVILVNLLKFGRGNSTEQVACGNQHGD